METLAVQTRIPMYSLGSEYSGGILKHSWEELEFKLMKQVSSLMGEHPFTVQFIRKQHEDYRTNELCLSLRAELSQVEIINHQPVRMLESTEPEIVYYGDMVETEKTYCEHCGGTTPDDERGNCFACGAPRPKDDAINLQRMIKNSLSGCDGITGSSYRLGIRVYDEHPEEVTEKDWKGIRKVLNWRTK